MPTDVDTVRLLTGATLTDIDDVQLAHLLEVHGGAVKLAAADLLEVIASRLESMSSDDVSVDGSKRAAVLMKRAQTLREQHEATDGGVFFFDVMFDGGGWPELAPRECY